MTAGPVSYSWGGTWLAGVKGSKNSDAASALSVYLSTDKTFQTWEAKTQNDFVSVKTVNDTVGKDASVSLLGGQNPIQSSLTLLKILTVKIKRNMTKTSNPSGLMMLLTLMPMVRLQRIRL